MCVRQGWAKGWKRWGGGGGGYGIAARTELITYRRLWSRLYEHYRNPMLTQSPSLYLPFWMRSLQHRQSVRGRFSSILSWSTHISTIQRLVHLAVRLRTRRLYLVPAVYRSVPLVKRRKVCRVDLFGFVVVFALRLALFTFRCLSEPLRLCEVAGWRSLVADRPRHAAGFRPESWTRRLVIHKAASCFSFFSRKSP